MKTNQRTLHKMLLVAIATTSLGAVSHSALARVDVQVAIPVPGIVVDERDPYYFSPNYCAGCWYGEWGGRTGYHRGGGRPWEREHTESDHTGRSQGSDVHHDGHH